MTTKNDANNYSNNQNYITDILLVWTYQKLGKSLILLSYLIISISLFSPTRDDKIEPGELSLRIINIGNQDWKKSHLTAEPDPFMTMRFHHQVLILVNISDNMPSQEILE